ncbi:hypothetical protein FB645_004458 [Coemansia sp. IMI 203386]|nr:hypothetical protein FB645_004458 [Coemansia sp. IMI 203386]
MSDQGSTVPGGSSADLDAPTTSVPQIHPFFMPLSSKRTHAVSAINGSKVSSSSVSSTAESQQPKRLKQKAIESVVGSDKRGRKSKANVPAASSSAIGKPTSLHTFFTVNSRRSAAQVETAPTSADKESAAGPCLVDEDTSDVSSSNNESKSAEFIFREPEIEVSKPKRPLFRSTGIPAPYPTENTHVPLPTHIPFAYKQASKTRKYQVHAIDTTCVYNAQSYITRYESLLSADGGCAQWSKTFKLDNLPTAKHHANAASEPYTVIRAMPATLGSQAVGIPLVPAHLQAIVPLVEKCGHKSTVADGTQSTQLLSLRYQPKRARDVLDNKRAVIKLHSWIEGMRLRRSAPVLDKICAAESRGALRSSLARDSRSLKWGNNDRKNSKKRSMVSSGDSDSSDDFMPNTALRRRRAKNELDDVVAWAQSDGSLSSFRENKRVGHQRHRRQLSGGSNSGSESESFANVVLLEGPSGSGKTAAVYACAEECGFEVYEINPGQRRSGKDVLAVLEDVILSHTITNPTTSTAGKTSTSVNQLLILIEEVDVLFEHDQRLWPALKQLALKSRRPIVLTCTDSSCLRWETFSFHFVLQFVRPSKSLLVPYCFLLCLCEGALVSPTDISDLCKTSNCDLNRIMCELDIAIRKVKLQSRSKSNGFAEQSSDMDLDIGGALTWLLNPLEPGETPESRYKFWIELIESVQPTGCAIPTWYSLWPDPPPSFEPPVLANEKRTYTSNRIANAHENSFFAQKARATAVMSSSNPLSIASMFISKSSALASSALPLFPITVRVPQVPALHSCVDQTTQMRSGIADTVGQYSLAGSNADSLDIVTSALNTLSLCCAITDDTPIHRECLREPLQSHTMPMTDNCLEVSYAVLDYDVLSRKNSMLLPDSANSTGKQTSADLDRYLRYHAAQILDQSSVAGMLESAEEYSAPPMPKTNISKEPSTIRQLRSALEFVCLKPQRYGLEQVAESAGYLSNMVTWDWIHQGKEPAPSTTASEHGIADDIGAAHQHLYRVGMRRTRMNTYRAHIKRMPVEMQHFVVHWSKYCL